MILLIRQQDGDTIMGADIVDRLVKCGNLVDDNLDAETHAISLGIEAEIAWDNGVIGVAKRVVKGIIRFVGIVR